VLGDYEAKSLARIDELQGLVNSLENRVCIGEWVQSKNLLQPVTAILKTFYFELF
jgi:hypothetical protein